MRLKNLPLGGLLEAAQEQQGPLHQEIGRGGDAVMADSVYRATLPQKQRGVVDSFSKGMVTMRFGMICDL